MLSLQDLREDRERVAGGVVQLRKEWWGRGDRVSENIKLESE